jgi:SAM-dependent methyltransferase
MGQRSFPLEIGERDISYDELPYVSMPFKACHPRTLAVSAQMAGLATAPLDQCRVLEIGCASGGHLLPIAATYPHSEFVGMDRSSRQVAAARDLAQAAELGNVQLHCDDLCRFMPQGSFDYIIAHGFYSWVPLPVRDRLLSLCGQCLSPRGVAFISYMVNPGAYVYCALRHVAQLAARGVPNAELGASVRRTTALLAEIAPKCAPRWGPVVAKWAKDMCAVPDATLLHDQMEATYHPVFLTEFVDHAAVHGLKYLADTTPDFSGLSAELRRQIEQLGSDRLVNLQALDVASFRMFRQSVLCRRDAELGRPDPLAVIEQAFIASDKLLPSDLAEKPLAAGIAPRGSLEHAALRVLAGRWPKTISFAELSRQVNHSDVAGPDRPLAGAILGMYEKEAVELWLTEPSFIDDGSDPHRARTTNLARVQAARGMPVTNLRHAAFTGQIDAARDLVVSLSGKQPSAEVLPHLAKLARNSMLVGPSDPPD